MGNSGARSVKDKEIIREKAIVEEDIIVKCSLEEIVKNFFKDYVIVWHDPKADSNENQDHKAQLEEFCQVLTFTEWEKARDYVQNTKAACYLVTSGTDGEQLVKKTFENENLCKIYVFCGNKQYHESWAKDYQKVACVETRIETVLNQIQKDLMEWLNKEDSLRLDLPAFAPIFDDRDKGKMNKLHLYLKMIPNFKNREQAKYDFLSISKRLYSRLGYTRDIENFEKEYNEYSKRQIVKWYTRNSFLFKVLNNCLRVATSDSIQYSRLVLKDLEKAIKEQYQAQSKNFSGVLYRGAYLSDEEWTSLKENKDKEIEMHGFLSVSKDKNVALSFMRFDQSQKVFITIIVPKGPNEEEQGFAEIEEFSYVQQENETLFNVRSRFMVLETEDKYSEELPYRHLVLLYGAQGFRKFVAEQNPTQQIIISSTDDISCTLCKVDEGPLLLSLATASPQNRIYYCKKCLDYNAAPFLCVPAVTKQTEKAFKTNVRGCLLLNSGLKQTPFYGYRCESCQKTKQKMYFVCIDCDIKHCDNCFDEMTFQCREIGHKIILEMIPFSFWHNSMSLNELNHFEYQDGFVKRNNHLFHQGQMYFESQEYGKAKEYYTHYIQRNEAKTNFINLAASYSNLGEIEMSQGRYNKALEYYLKSLDIKKSIYGGDNHPDIAASYNNIGSVYESQGEYKKALECFLKSLDIWKSIYGGDNHPDIATSYNNIGSVYESQGEYNKALEYYLKSLDIKKSIYGGDNHPDVATSYNNIGLVYKSQGEYKKALENYLKSLDIKKSIYGGDNHPHIATSYNNIGLVYESQGEYKKALECFLKSLDIKKSIYGGDNHPHIATSYNNIGLVYKSQGEYKKALECFLKSLDIMKSIYGGDNHPDVATSYNNIGSVYESQGEYKKALEYHLKSLDIWKSIYGGDNHSHIATSYNNIGLVYESQGEYKKALEYYLKSLDIWKSIYGGDNHPDIATSYNNIGSVYKSQGEYKKALEYHLKSLRIRKFVYGDDHPKTLFTSNQILEMQSIDLNKD